MKKQIGVLFLAGAILGTPLVFSGCAVTQGRETAKAYTKDKEIAARIKTALYTDKSVKGTQIAVNALNGVVQLSGFVDSQSEKDRAGQIAASTPGVAQVINNLVLPTGTRTGHLENMTAPETNSVTHEEFPVNNSR